MKFSKEQNKAMKEFIKHPVSQIFIAMFTLISLVKFLYFTIDYIKG
jgi:hypothetical protein